MMKSSPRKCLPIIEVKAMFPNEGRKATKTDVFRRYLKIEVRFFNLFLCVSIYILQFFRIEFFRPCHTANVIRIPPIPIVSRKMEALKLSELLN